MEILAWIWENKYEVLGVLVALLSVGAFVARFTKTDKDDAFFARAIATIKMFLPGRAPGSVSAPLVTKAEAEEPAPLDPKAHQDSRSDLR